MSIEDNKTPIDPQIAQWVRKQSEMEQVINQFKDLREKRDQELNEIKETIRECQEKVADYIEEMPFGKRSNSITAISTMVTPDIDFQHPGTWKLVGGLFLMLYILNTNVCYFFIPAFPKIFSHLNYLMLLLHFFIAAMGPFVFRVGSQMGLNENTLKFYNEVVQPNTHAIGTVISTLGIIFLKLKRCSVGYGCSSCLQLCFTIATFIAELSSASFNVSDEDQSSKKPLCLPLLIILNLTFSFFVK